MLDSFIDMPCSPLGVERVGIAWTLHTSLVTYMKCITKKRKKRFVFILILTVTCPGPYVPLVEYTCTVVWTE